MAWRFILAVTAAAISASRGLALGREHPPRVLRDLQQAGMPAIWKFRIVRGAGLQFEGVFLEFRQPAASHRLAPRDHLRRRGLGDAE